MAKLIKQNYRLLFVLTSLSICLSTLSFDLQAENSQISGDAVFAFSLPDGFSHGFGEKPGSAVYIKNPNMDTITVFKIAESVEEYSNDLFNTVEEKVLLGSKIQWKYKNPLEKIFLSGVKCYYNVGNYEQNKNEGLFLGIFNFSGKWYYIEVHSKQSMELAKNFMDSIKPSKGKATQHVSIPNTKQIVIIGLLGLLGIAAIIALF